MAEDFGFFSSSESGAPEAADEDPAAAFLAQQESEIAGIENDPGFGAPAASQVASAQPGLASGGESAQRPGTGALRPPPGAGGPVSVTPGLGPCSSLSPTMQGDRGYPGGVGGTVCICEACGKREEPGNELKPGLRLDLLTPGTRI